MTKLKRRILIFCTLFIGLAILWQVAGNQRSPATNNYSAFVEQVNGGQVASVVVSASKSGLPRATYRLKSGEMMRTILPPDYRDALQLMQRKLVNVEIKEAAVEPLAMAMNALPVLFLLGIWLYLLRKFPRPLQERTSNGGLASF
jgi:cell division protease FtsH